MLKKHKPIQQICTRFFMYQILLLLKNNGSLTYREINRKNKHLQRKQKTLNSMNCDAA